ncbi:hypothetical protein ACMA46_04015 [Clavibacter sp. Sh2141]|uniref:hypothetical protein n=1 Tax=Clavibacter sp. Sh2141 TaxID=3395374 RepID=UPI0039BCB8CA
MRPQRAGGGRRDPRHAPLPRHVDSDFLALRPTVPDAAERAAMLTPDDVARAALFVLASPPPVRIDELVLSPMSQRGGF